MTPLEQLMEDLDDVARPRIGRFARADAAHTVACRVMQGRDVNPEKVITAVESWWNALHSGSIQADIFLRLALIESLRDFARGGS